MTDQKLLCEITDSYKTNIITTRLDSAGIQSWVLNKQDSSYMTFGSIEIYVLESDWENARALLNVEEE